MLIVNYKKIKYEKFILLDKFINNMKKFLFIKEKKDISPKEFIKFIIKKVDQLGMVNFGVIIDYFNLKGDNLREQVKDLIKLLVPNTYYWSIIPAINERLLKLKIEKKQKYFY